MGASLTVIAGFAPDGMKLGPLKRIASMQLLGSKDDSKHLDVVNHQLQGVGIYVTTQIFKGAKHDTVARHIDKVQFWDWLEGAHQRLTKTTNDTIAAQTDQEPEGKARAGERAKTRGREKNGRTEKEDAPNEEDVEVDVETLANIEMNENSKENAAWDEDEDQLNSATEARAKARAKAKT